MKEFMEEYGGVGVEGMLGTLRNYHAAWTFVFAACFRRSAA